MVWIGSNGVSAFSCSYTNPNCVWQNSTQTFANITNSTSPLGAIQHIFGQQLPWFWPLLPFALYIWLFITFSDSPGKGKIYMITGLVFVISVFLALGGYIADAVINFIIFVLAFWLSGLFSKGGGTISG
jgi:hypothetical protein